MHNQNYVSIIILFSLILYKIREIKNVINMFLNIILFALAISLKGQFTLTLSNQNGTSSSTTVDNMKAICSSAPISNLNLCSNKCLQCSVSSSGKCSSCNTQYALSNQDCIIDNSIHNYSDYDYLNSGNITRMKLSITQFIDTVSETSLPEGRVLHVCQSDTYQMLMGGLFTVNEKVGLRYTFTDNIDQIQIRLNLISIIKDITFVVEANQITFFKNKYSFFSDLAGAYGISFINDTKQGGYLTLNALKQSTVGSVVTPVDTGVKQLISNDITISFHSLTENNLPQYKYFWGFSDVLVIQRSCETCVTKAVTDLMMQIITVVYIMAIVVIILVVILVVLINLEIWKRKAEFKDKLGSAADNLPMKALDRIIETLQKTTKAMDKEFKMEEKTFLKLTKKQ